ncbi:MAG: class I SAM-dependent methyltransferase [Pseudomonadota bacterium]
MLASSSKDNPLALELAQQLKLDAFGNQHQAREFPAGGLLIYVCEGITGLIATGPKAPGFVPVGFEQNDLAQRRKARQNELLGKAVGWREKRAPSVLDATAGYGIDAFLLADLGCRVSLCERNTVMGVLLQQAIKRTQESEDPWLRQVGSRLNIQPGSAQALSDASALAADVIYLDPMFPTSRRGAPGKAMQLLQQLLEGTDREASNESDPNALFAWAIASALKRVVVKRPRKEPSLEGPPPSHQLTGKSVRFDVYQLA